MRKYFFLTMISMLLGSEGFCLPNTDSTVNVLVQQVSTLSAKVDGLSKQVKDSLAAFRQLQIPAKKCSDEPLGFAQVLFVLLPVLLFLLAAFLVRSRLRAAGFRLSDALSTFRQKTVTTINKTFGVDNNPIGSVEQEETQDEPVRSASRTIAFLTAVVALIIAVVITSYTGYQIITGCNKDVSLDGLWKILVALGIGVIPYGANVMTGNAKENPQKPPPGP